MSETKALAYAASPLQLLNIYAAMKKFNVFNCDVYILNDGESNRHLQMQQCADLFGLKYILVSAQQMNIKSFQLLLSLLKSPFQKKMYEYLFFGDYRNGYVALYLTQYLKKGGRVIFVDDGNISISILRGLDVDKKTQLFYNFFDIWSRILGVSAKDYFTIYRQGDNCKFNVIPNDMLGTISCGKICDEIFFIGPAVGALAKDLGVSPNYVLDCIKQTLNKIKDKYSSEQIVFVPHGRFDNEIVENICKKIGVEYRRLDLCVELYCVRRGCFPKIVYNIGSSSCLINIKQISPKTKVYDCDIQFSNEKNMKIYEEIRSYYAENGVEYICM